MAALIKAQPSRARRRLSRARTALLAISLVTGRGVAPGQGAPSRRPCPLFSTGLASYHPLSLERVPPYPSTVTGARHELLQQLGPGASRRSQLRRRPASSRM